MSEEAIRGPSVAHGGTERGGASSFRGAVLHRLGARVAARLRASWAEIESHIAEEAGRLRQTHPSNPQGRGPSEWLERACLILAAYRALSALGEPASRVLEDLRAAVVEHFREGADQYLAARFGIEGRTGEDAFACIAENFKTRGEARFGPAFKYAQDVQDATRSFITIQRCGYFDFFRAHGAAEATRVFCALDIAWADELTRRRYPVSFERPTTIAQGDDACRFQFTRSTVTP
jgi:predicted nucleic-acid-binding Zn-ribbon protein